MSKSRKLSNVVEQMDDLWWERDLEKIAGVKKRVRKCMTKLYGKKRSLYNEPKENQ